MKKSIPSALLATLGIVLVAFAYNIDVVSTNAGIPCNTAAGVKCPLGTSRTYCKAGESVGAGGNCHCNAGLTRASDGWCGGKPGEEEGGEENCDAVQSTYDDLNNQYTAARQELDKAQTDLASSSAAYQNALSLNPTKVKPVATFDTKKCIDPDYKDNCGEDSGEVATSESATTTSGTCTDITAQCKQLSALLVSTNQSACIIEGQAAALKEAYGAGTSTTATTTTATSTATATAAFVVSVNPVSVRQGETFTLNATINSSSVQTYSINATKDGSNLGNLMSNVIVGTAARPTNISQSFQTSASIPVGTYILKIFNDANSNQFATTSVNVTVSTGSTAPIIFNPGTTTGTPNYTGSTSYNNGSNVIFLNPTANSTQRIGTNVLIHWGYNAAVSGNIDLYVQTVCSNGNSGCTPSTTLIASGQPVVNVYFNWFIPSYIQANSWAVLIAKQGNTVVGFSPTFIIL
jgi:hypothetical protein